MVIASIDLQNSRVVQLRQGTEKVLERDNPPELALEFDRYGEVAVIDLDAAMGKGSNFEIIKPLLRKAECRVGGGIRTPEQAKELVSQGARKIIIGSVAFRDASKKGAGTAGGEFIVNIPVLESMAQKIGRQRLIVAVDARNGELIVDGWKTPTGLNLFEAAKAVEPYASELLFTCIEREGTLTGTDTELIKKLSKTVSCKITAAGGVSSLNEISELASLGCDVQLGMALYTGKVNLADAFIQSLNWKKGMPYPPPRDYQASSSPDAPMSNAFSPLSPYSLLPIIVQSPDGQILMTGFTDAAALAETFKRGYVCFFSRSRGRLWMKGETSGNLLKLIRIRADCDRDAILAIAEPVGPICHTGAWSCFDTNRKFSVDFLHNIITERFQNPVPGSYTATLDDELVREKIMEEAGELCAAKSHDELVWEAADLLYFSTALLARSGVSVCEIIDELDRRHKK